MSQEGPARFNGPNHLRAPPEDVPATQDDERGDPDLPDVTGRNLSAALNEAEAVIRRKVVMKIKSLVILCFALACNAAASRELHSYALIQNDGSLLIEGKRVHLYGVRLPDMHRRCRSNISPARCGSRAMLALDFRIQGFVHCYPQTKNADGSLNAICYVDRSRFDQGEDLAAYLLERGLALASPNAPFEYHALERIARHHHRGIWGFSVDTIRIP